MMMLPIRIEHLNITLLFFALTFIAMLMRVWWHKSPTYIYSLAHACNKQGLMQVHMSTVFFFISRIGLLSVLALLIGRLQYADTHMHITINGIDIMLVLDVSGSMQYQDFEDDDRSRLEVAKAEAKRFIEKRDNDAVGLVIFGNDALSRCPLTLDKPLLKNIVSELHTGIIDPQGTVLARGIVAGASRLKHASAKSKIMIVLTDGNHQRMIFLLPMQLQ